MNYKFDKIFSETIEYLKQLNPLIGGTGYSEVDPPGLPAGHRLRKVVIANRGEIAKRFFLALHEEGIPTVAVVSDADRGQSWYEFADEVVFIGDNFNYSNIPVIIAAAYLARANAIYPGYGFISECADFVSSVNTFSSEYDHEIIFMGPNYDTMHLLGDKVRARALARENDIPLFESSGIILNEDMDTALQEAGGIGYPVMVKLSIGGGGRGIYIANGPEELREAVQSCTRLGREQYGDPSFYIEKYIEDPIHMEVQIFNGWAVSLRKCAVQRRNQKIIEESGHTFIDDHLALSLMAAAEKIALLSGYSQNGGAGTVEFLIDNSTGRFGFMEINTRLQVEYAVTDQSLGIDLAKWQVLYFDGREDNILLYKNLKNRSPNIDHSIECRIYAEDPENDYMPSPGVIIEMDLPTFNGIRCDFGFSKGDSILPMFDPMIGKLISNGSSREESLIRMERALQELYIKGVKTNISQLLKIVRHQKFREGNYTNRLLDDFEELKFPGPGGGDSGGVNLNPVIFGTFTEYIRLIQEAVRQYIIMTDIERYTIPKMDQDIPSRFNARFNDISYRVEFVQVTVDTSHVFIDSSYRGKIRANSFNERSDDLIVIFGNRSYRIRLDRFSNALVLRMKNENNKIDYYQLEVVPEGKEETDPVHLVKSPFPGTFVSFPGNGIAVGDLVEEGEELIVLSSMKMDTTITSPVTGTITWIIEDGNLQNLMRAQNRNGLFVGRSIQEGEVLFIIECPDECVTGGPAERDKKAVVQGEYGTASSFMNSLLSDTPLEEMTGYRESDVELLFELLRAVFSGFIRDSRVVERTAGMQQEMPADLLLGYGPGENAIAGIISHYVCIKKLFSSTVTETGLSLNEEMVCYTRKNEDREAATSEAFRELLGNLLRFYGKPDWESRVRTVKIFNQYIFLLLNRSYQACLANRPVIGNLVEVLSRKSELSGETLAALNRLLEIEQGEIDDSLAKQVKGVLTDKQGSTVGGTFNSLGAALPSGERRPDGGLLDVTILPRFEKALESPGEDLIPSRAPQWVRENLAGKLDRLTGVNRVARLHSPLPGVFQYRVQGKGEGAPVRYMSCCFVDLSRSEAAEDIGVALADCGRMLRTCQDVSPASGSWIEIVARGRAFIWNADVDADGCISYRELKKQLSPGEEIFDGRTADVVILEADVLFIPGDTAAFRRILFKKSGGGLSYEFLNAGNTADPYPGKEPSKHDAAMYKNNKWPIDMWAGECFDPGTMEEITIPSIDGSENSEEEAMLARKPVASKIFSGKIRGTDACFYMKDFRVSGGATGSREGLKYLAAAYISFMKGWPLYVWNDSAGANIMEGVVSLNRGAEGFMMNTLLSDNVDHKKFSMYIRNSPDPVLADLVEELNGQFTIDPEKVPDEVPGLRLVAVGTGPSAGLDVYGSSQATIQILLDSEQSFRVLTGSNVIQSVMGENISNYNIGGAKILGTWTGIVDFVAEDKIHLLSTVHQVHHYFFESYTNDSIVRKNPDALSQDGDEPCNDSIVITGRTIKRNIDNEYFIPFKRTYNESEALIGGFTKLGGRQLLVMAARTHSGLRSTQSIIKATELLHAAHRTGCDQVLFFGRNWTSNQDLGENRSLRARFDLAEAMNRKTGSRIHVITDIEGFNEVEVNASSDIIIFFKKDEIPPSDLLIARKNAAVIAESFTEAFDIVLKILILMEKKRKYSGAHAPKGKPSIPPSPETPYNIVTAVIENVFDSNSFLELYGEMNDLAAGPSLITGLAFLKGRAVGVIADNPLIKGGGADAPGTEKFRLFTEFLNRKNIPLVMLSNSSGFVPGSKEERFRIQAIGARSLDANVLGTIPVVSVVLHQNYGGRLIQAFNRFLRPGIVYLALENSVMAVLGVNAAFDLLLTKKYRKLVEKGHVDDAERLRERFYTDYLEKAKAKNDALGTGVLDWTIPDVSELRKHLVRGLDLATERCRQAFAD